MKITRKLLTPTLIFFSLLIAGLITYNTVVSLRQYDAAEKEDLKNMSEVFNARLKAKEDLAVALASEVANNPEVQAAFAAQDRERLIELTLPAYQVIDEQFDVPQFQFHLPPATSFLRLHNLDKYGDDLSSFRFTVLTANGENRIVEGAEIGRAGLGVRGVVPVSYQESHIGTVEFGIDVGSSLIEELKNDFGYDIQILLSRLPAEVATFAGATGESEGPIDELLFQVSTLENPVFAPATDYTQVLAGNTSYGRVKSDNLEYAVYGFPLYDYSGNVIGVVDIISDHTVIVQQQNTQVISSVVILLLMLLVGSFGFAYFAGLILRPIGTLTSAASNIAAGDFSKRTNVKGNDELGKLAQVFDSMAAQLQELFGNLERRVEDRTKALVTSAEVSRYLTSILDPNELAREVVNQVQSAFNYYYAQIYLFDEKNDNLVLTAGTGEPGAEMLKRGHSLLKGRGLVGRAAEKNESILVLDTSEDPNWLPNELLPDTKAEAVVPISIGDQVFGVLDVQDDVTNDITPEDITLLESLAGQVAISLQNAESYARAESALQEAKSLVEYAAEGILVLDLTNGLFSEPNENASKIYGLSREELVKVGPAQMSPPTQPDGRDSNEKAMEMIGIAMEKGTNVFEWNHINGQGEEFPCEIRLVRLPGDHPRLRVTVTDITERQALQKLVAQRARQQEAINTITQRIQAATTIEEAMQVAARELGHAVGNRQTIIALEPSALGGNGQTSANK